MDELDVREYARWRRATYALLKRVDPGLVVNLTLSNDSWESTAGRQRWLHSRTFQPHVVDELLFGYRQLVQHVEVPIKDKLRLIWKPSALLQRVLESIRRRLLQGTSLPAVLHGYVRRHSILTCAAVHQTSRFLLAFDLADAFETRMAEYGIRQLCRQRSVKSGAVASTLRYLIAPNQCFPQGYCTSPLLFNLALTDLAIRLTTWCEQYHWRLSIYSDNIFLSCDELSDDPLKTTRTVKRLIESYKWTVNDRKTRFTDREQHGALPLLGLVIRSGQIVCSHARLRSLRSQWWQIASQLAQSTPAEVEQLQQRVTGQVQFLKQIYGERLPTLLRAPLRAIECYP